MRDVEAAWLAGLIDGDGSIWSRWPKRTNVAVEIKMTCLATVQRVNELVPGRLVPGHLSKNAWGEARQFRWSIDTLGAEKLLMEILPYLVTKRKAAEAAIELCRRPVDKAHMDYWASVLKSTHC